MINVLKKSFYFAVTVALISAAGCKAKEKTVQVSYAGPPTIIYKTKVDYSKNVPVTLSDDKTSIVAYPSPKDVYYNGSLAYPNSLSKGFLLDNRGISPNSAFLKLTYEEYSKLSEAPKLSEMMNLIIDKEPFTAIYNLGVRYSFKNEVSEINAIIEHNGLKNYKRLK